MDHYKSVEALAEYLKNLTSESWPIREVCSLEEAERRVALHRQLPDRIVLKSVAKAGKGCDDDHVGYSTFNSAPGNELKGWDAICKEQSIHIEFADGPLRKQIRTSIEERIEQMTQRFQNDLQHVQANYLGAGSELSQIMKDMANIPAADRRRVGEQLNFVVASIKTMTWADRVSPFQQKARDEWSLQVQPRIRVSEEEAARIRKSWEDGT